MRYLAPPVTLLGCAISIITGALFNPILYLPAAVYALFVAVSSLAISRSIREFISLLAIIPTMHFAWGAGFITSTKALR
jgi:hypothetical protein